MMTKVIPEPERAVKRDGRSDAPVYQISLTNGAEKSKHILSRSPVLSAVLCGLLRSCCAGESRAGSAAAVVRIVRGVVIGC